MELSVELVDEVEKNVEGQLAELQANDSTWRTTRRGVLGAGGAGGAGLAGFDSGSARTSWVDTGGA